MPSTSLWDEAYLVNGILERAPLLVGLHYDDHVVLADISHSVDGVELGVCHLLQQLVHGGHSLVVQHQRALLGHWGLHGSKPFTILTVCSLWDIGSKDTVGLLIHM